jgi:hypothetical protein
MPHAPTSLVGRVHRELWLHANWETCSLPQATPAAINNSHQVNRPPPPGMHTHATHRQDMQDGVVPDGNPPLAEGDTTMAEAQLLPGISGNEPVVLSNGCSASNSHT